MNRTDFILWSGILGGPIAWFLSLEANFAIAPWACGMHWEAALNVITIVALAITLASGFASWTQWNAQQSTPAEVRSGRTMFMAMSGVVLEVGFFLVILAQGIPNWMHGCP